MIKVLNRAKNLNYIIGVASKEFEKNSYVEVLLPLYEHYDILKDAAWDFKDENIIRFIDRYSGKSMVLRPDFTPQVCRFVSLYLNEFPRPIRLFYKGRIFRNVDLNKGLKSEKYQIGCELFGVKEFLGDTEIIFLASHILQGLGVNDFKIVIGDSSLVNAVLNLFEKQKDEILECLKKKSFNSLDKIFKDGKISERDYIFLSTFIRSFGHFSVIDDLIEKSSNFKDVLARLVYLKDLFKNLESVGINGDKLIFDACEMRGFEYYTGINFDILSADGNVLCGGGRYDSLMNKFGSDMQACGFAFNLEEVINLVQTEDEKQEFDYLLVGEPNFKKAFDLKKEGYKVIWVEADSEVNKFKELFKFKKIIM